MALKKVVTKPHSKILQTVIDQCNTSKFPSTSLMQRLSAKERPIADHYVKCLTEENAAKLSKLANKEAK